jgi:hypothetical protein
MQDNKEIYFPKEYMKNSEIRRYLSWSCTSILRFTKKNNIRKIWVDGQRGHWEYNSADIAVAIKKFNQ